MGTVESAAGRELRPPPKRNFFRNRPAWAKSVAEPPADQIDGDGVSMFSRSAETLAEIKKSNAARRERERSKERKDKRTKRGGDSSKLEIVQAVALSSDDSADEAREDGGASVQTSDSSAPSKLHRNDEDKLPPSPRAEMAAAYAKKQAATRTSPRKKRYYKEAIDEEEESDLDKELAALSARNEERRRTAMMEEPQQPTKKPRAPDGPRDRRDAVVKILVHSKMPDTQPLLIMRKLSQNLGHVKTAWCHHQGIAEDEQQAMVLTWRDRRLYSSTTCGSLGITEEVDGEIYISEPRGLRRVEGGQIEMEVMTNEQFAQRQSEQEREKRARLHPTESPIAEAPKKEKKIPIVLKAPGFDDYKLRVRPTTTFDEIVFAWKKQRAVAEDKHVFLMFDGEKLSGQSTMAESDISDLDHIDVYVR